MKSSKNIVISATELSKTFTVPHEKIDSLKGRAFHIFKKQSQEEYIAFKDVNFEVYKGEFFGIIGKNGSGKSTLLKILGGIYRPSSGSVSLNGSLATFIELGVGFNPDLSGRDNIYLNGAILGMSRKDIEKKYEAILNFSELEHFIDQKVKNYSSGMQVRLAFAIAIQAEADILLVDEVLAVGDNNFQAKCFDVFRELKKAGKTIIFVGHDMTIIRDFCDRAMLISKGEVKIIGKPQKVINEYNALNVQAVEDSFKEEGLSDKKRWGNGYMTIQEVWTESSKKKNVFRPQEEIKLVLKAKVNTDSNSPVYGFIVRNLEGMPIFVTNTRASNVSTPTVKKGDEVSVSCEFENVFTNGTYLITSAISNHDATIFYDWIEDAHKFTVGGQKISDGVLQPGHKYKVRKI